MINIYCDNKCCKYSSIAYVAKPCFLIKKQKIKKAGIFITTKDLKKVILVQSRGNYWGPPKGTINRTETIEEGAIREVKEETGLEFTKEDLGDVQLIKSNSYYYHISIDEKELKVQTKIQNNDANGIGWFNVHCLEENIRSGKIKVNQHCKQLLKKIYGIDWG